MPLLKDFLIYKRKFIIEKRENADKQKEVCFGGGLFVAVLAVPHSL